VATQYIRRQKQCNTASDACVISDNIIYMALWTSRKQHTVSIVSLLFGNETIHKVDAII